MSQDPNDEPTSELPERIAVDAPTANRRLGLLAGKFAVARGIEIIGEAARSVSRGFQQAHPEIPWGAIVGMRHRRIHDYNQVDLDVVWTVARDRLSELIAVPEPLVLVPPPGADD